MKTAEGYAKEVPAYDVTSPDGKEDEEPMFACIAWPVVVYDVVLG
jgi:hypothetical protein